MAKRLTADELFREFATTDSPFEKWRLFSHITNEATFIFLPNHLQKNLCNLQFGIFEELRSSDTEKVKAAQALMKWLYPTRPSSGNIMRAQVRQQFIAHLKV
jgi:hypothetical protein